MARATVRGEDLAAPDLLDVETVSVLRKRWLAKDLTARRFRVAVVVPRQRSTASSSA